MNREIKTVEAEGVVENLRMNKTAPEGVTLIKMLDALKTARTISNEEKSIISKGYSPQVKPFERTRPTA